MKKNVFTTVIRAKILLLLALCCLHLALLRPVVCVLCRRSSCATPATGSRSSARRTRTATSASRHAPSASTAAIRSAFELACTDEVSTNLLASTVHNTDRPLQGSRGYPRGYIKGFISSQNSPSFSGSTFNIPSRFGGDLQKPQRCKSLTHTAQVNMEF